MTNHDLQIMELRGELQLERERVKWFADCMDFWRRKYLKEHPNLDNWEYTESAWSEEDEHYWEPPV